MLKREHYLSKVRGFYDSDLIKVITGVRRCGKSVVLNEIKEELVEKSENIIYLNFEHAMDLAAAPDSMSLINYVKKNRKRGKCYVLLDEVQNVENWPEAVRTLRLENNSVFITGSNSKLLSREFLNELSGRFVSFQIRPFVYQEIVDYSKQLKKKTSVLDYLIWGGFPKRFEFKTEEEMKSYLFDLDDTIIVHDLVARYKIRNEVLFKMLVNYVLQSNSRIFSAKSVYKYIKNEQISCSINTIVKYIEYLKEAYLIEGIPLYSTKVKRELIYYTKLYDIDVCFNSLRADNARYDLEHNLENIVYNELIYRGYKVKLFNINGHEIDFHCVKGGKTFYVQVAYSVINEKTYEREMKPFSMLDNAHQKILITTDDIDCSTSTVRHIKLKDFLMLEEL